MSALVLEVTQELIDEGEPWSSGYCAIALAARRAGLTSPLMSHDGCLDADGLKWWNLSAGKWAQLFDEDPASVAPRTFRFRTRP